MKLTVDDLCLEYLDNFNYFDDLKDKVSDLKVIAFAISNFKNKEDLKSSDRFKEWFDNHKDWVEIAVHSYDHDGLPDGDREDEGLWIGKALNNLRQFLPDNYGYRSPGWQTTNKTVPILRELGFSYIAYESKIRDLKTDEIVEDNLINSHIYDINEIKKLINKFGEGVGI